MKKIVFLQFILALLCVVATAQGYPLKKVLIITEKEPDLKSESSGAARDLAQLLGHFNTKVNFKSISTYKAHEIDQFDYLFYVGISAENHPSAVLIRDILNTGKPVVWLNTGISELVKNIQNQNKYGFEITRHMETSEFDAVRTNSYTYTKGNSEINLIQIKNRNQVETWAEAYSSGTKARTPYMVKSGNLVYVADLPFLGAKVTDRYLLFADKLHDILTELHPELHTAVLRIEDVTPLYEPAKLRQVADFLSAKEIPFLVAVVPFYVNPQENSRVSLSDRPELVDALKYMVANGGSVVMHGTTHPYTGITANDGEFWDAANSKPLPGENPEEFANKIEMG